MKFGKATHVLESHNLSFSLSSLRGAETTSEAKDALITKAKDVFGDPTGWSADFLSEVGSLINNMDLDDLDKIPEGAVSCKS